MAILWAADTLSQKAMSDASDIRLLMLRTSVYHWD